MEFRSFQQLRRAYYGERHEESMAELQEPVVQPSVSQDSPQASNADSQLARQCDEARATRHELLSAPKGERRKLRARQRAQMDEIMAQLREG